MIVDFSPVKKEQRSHGEISNVESTMFDSLTVAFIRCE